MRKLLIESDPPCIKSHTAIAPSFIDPSAINLPLGTQYFVMSASARPGETYTIMDLVQQYREDECELEEGTKFESGRIYLVKLAWNLELPRQICARATAKSSIGRLDALVRLVADHESEFETVSPGGRCQLWVEIRPNTFALTVGPGDALSQLRFLRGEEHLCTVSPRVLKFEDAPPLVSRDGRAVPIRPSVGDRSSVLLHLDLDDDPALGFVGFMAKRPEEMPEPINPSLKNHYDPKQFWTPVQKESGKKFVRIEPNRFYIFRSKERFRVPAHLAVDCRAVSESLGDIRIHYAGFAHPFFGLNRTEGTPLIFEVRGYQLPTILHDNTALAKVYFRRMSSPALPVEESAYTDQELTLSKCFKQWT